MWELGGDNVLRRYVSFIFLLRVILHQGFIDLFLLIGVLVPKFWLLKSGVLYIEISLNKW